MSNQQSSSASYSYSSYSSSSSTSRSGRGESQRSGQAYSTQSYTDPSGHTTVKTTSQNLGEQPVSETRRYDAQGRSLAAPGGAGSDRRIEDVTDRDAEYEERMEDEYAKREGGA